MMMIMIAKLIAGEQDGRAAERLRPRLGRPTREMSSRVNLMARLARGLACGTYADGIRRGHLFW